MQLDGSKTERNLLRTFAGESRARNKYTFYAEKSEKEGYEYVASIFQATANNEKAHARVVFDKFLKMNKSTADNLMDSAKVEAFESTKLYKQFENEARVEGFMEIADFYKELREVEASQDYNNEENIMYNRYRNMNTDNFEDIGERQQTFTLEELSKYNGKGGNAAYVAVNGIVYDVSSVWAGGIHNGVAAGTEATESFNTCHGASNILNKLPKVGVVTG
ncbi:MAG: ferritin family protein [Clostridium sp.]|uniref:ferritin family protein n=1 Tax=Clostridium sp. TaxID=1506 RepID=UPI003D6C805F